jgi:hypothetical protein
VLDDDADDAPYVGNVEQRANHLLGSRDAKGERAEEVKAHRLAGQQVAEQPVTLDPLRELLLAPQGENGDLRGEEVQTALSVFRAEHVAEEGAAVHVRARPASQTEDGGSVAALVKAHPRGERVITSVLGTEVHRLGHSRAGHLHEIDGTRRFGNARTALAAATVGPSRRRTARIVLSFGAIKPGQGGGIEGA